MPTFTEWTEKLQKGGDPKYHEKNTEVGKKFARDRISLLCDKDSFIEDALFANCLAEGLPADGVVTGPERSSGEIRSENGMITISQAHPQMVVHYRIHRAAKMQTKFGVGSDRSGKSIKAGPHAESKIKIVGLADMNIGGKCGAVAGQTRTVIAGLKAKIQIKYRRGPQAQVAAKADGIRETQAIIAGQFHVPDLPAQVDSFNCGSSK